MVYKYYSKYTGHKKDSCNPLNPKRRLYELILIGYGYGLKENLIEAAIYHIIFYHMVRSVSYINLVEI